MSYRFDAVDDLSTLRPAPRRFPSLPSSCLPTVLFLDFDGVLHDDVDLTTEVVLFREIDRLEALLDDYPDVSLVLSTSWQLLSSRTRLATAARCWRREMNPKLDALLCSRYPDIYRNPLTGEPSEYFGFSIAEGWFVLVDTLSGEIQRYVDALPDERFVRASDVKEKYGELSYNYFGGGDDDRYLDGLIWLAEHLSQRICQECGTMDCASHTWWRRDPPPETRRLPAVRNPAWIPIAEEMERALHSAVRRGAPEVVIDAVIETETLAFKWHGGNREIAGFFRMAEAFSARVGERAPC